jgi:hypothetical protein
MAPCVCVCLKVPPKMNNFTCKVLLLLSYVLDFCLSMPKLSFQGIFKTYVAHSVILGALKWILAIPCKRKFPLCKRKFPLSWPPCNDVWTGIWAPTLSFGLTYHHPHSPKSPILSPYQLGFFSWNSFANRWIFFKMVKNVFFWGVF